MRKTTPTATRHTTRRTLLPYLGNGGVSETLSRTHASSAAAFPGHTDYACAVECYRRRLKLDEWVALAALGCAVIWLIWG